MHVTENPVDISLVVVTYNRAELLRKALRSLIGQVTEGRFTYEILVIDDGSQDHTTGAMVQEIAALADPLPVRYVYKTGGGEGDARNRGVQESRGSWIAFSDDDQLAEPNWLLELYKAAQATGADCVDGSVHLILPEPCPMELGWRARAVLGEKILSRTVGPYSNKDTIGAGNILIRKALFHQVGGFDITFRQSVDTDFFWRVELGGFKTCYTPHAVVHHIIPESRLSPAYLRGVSLRIGVACARIQSKYETRLKFVGSMAWRLGVAVGRDCFLLTIGALLSDSALRMDGRCCLWYSLGFLRGGLNLLAPGWLKQEKFFHSLYLSYHGANREPGR